MGWPAITCNFFDSVATLLHRTPVKKFFVHSTAFTNTRPNRFLEKQSIFYTSPGRKENLVGVPYYDAVKRATLSEKDTLLPEQLQMILIFYVL